MKVLFTILMIFCLYPNLYSEELFYINFNGKSDFIESLISELEKNEEEIVILLLNPNSAPRLEANINLSLNTLYQVIPQEKVITLVGYPRLNSALQYIEKSNFNSKILVDTTMVLFDELKIRKAPPIYTKWSKDGRLLNYQVLYGIIPTDTSVWHNLYYKKKENVVKNNVTEKFINNSGYNFSEFENFKRTKVEKVVDIKEGSDNPIGILYGLTIDPENRNLITTDNMNLKTLVFDLEKGELLQTLFLNYNQRKMFSKKLPDVYFKEVEQRKTAGTLFFKPFFSGDKLIVTATLPRVELNVVNGDSSLSLYNVGCLVYFNYNQNKYVFDKIEEIEFNLESKLIPTHTTVGELNKFKLPLPIIKGYPAVGFTKENRPKDELPIFDEFYEEAPLFQLVDIRNGKILKNIGKLNKINQYYGSGYYFNSPRVTFYKEESIISQHLVPFLEFEKGSNLQLKSYFDKDIVNDNSNELISVPSTEEMDIVNIKSKAAIVSIKALNDDVFVLWKLREQGKVVRNSSIFILQKYNILTKELDYEEVVPFNYKNLKLIDYIIDSKLKKLVCLYQSPTEIKLIYYKLN